MRTAALATLALASTASAVSTSSIISTFSSFLTTECRTALTGLIAPNSTLGQCLRTDLIESALNETGSLIPDIDAYLSSYCSASPCSNATLQDAAQTILTSCATDLTRFGSSFGVSNQTVEAIFELQPLAREVLCLKTADPYSAANATIPITNGTYNSTNGTFCATSVLTELSSYLGTNLTLSYVETLALGGNATALQLLEAIPPTALCNDCVFAAIDIVELEYPGLANYTYAGYGVNSFLNANCSASGLMVSTNGTLPANITESAVNSSFPYNVTNGLTNYTATSSAVPTPANVSGIMSNLTSAAGNTTALKKRWIGA